jgi:trimethyllysine dioxygenase
MKLRHCEASESGLLLTWHNHSQAQFDYFWLRDNARDARSFNAASHQRALYTAAVPLDIKPRSFSVADSGDLVVVWPDLPEAIEYSAEFLYRYRAPGSEYLYHNHNLWDADSLQVTPVPYAGLNDQETQVQLLQTLQANGFVLLQGCPLDKSAVTAVASLLGYVRETIFGGVWQFEDNQEMADSAYTADALRPHTDGTYSHDAPGLQLLTCLVREATGGESILVDGFHVAAQFKASQPDLYDAMTRFSLTGTYQGDGHVLRASRPVFRLDNEGRLIQVTFNNYDRDTVRLADADMRTAYEGIVAIDQLLNLEQNQWRYVLEAGEMLVFDNWRLLHGRLAYKGRRRMAGAYINREDFESKLRGKGLM